MSLGSDAHTAQNIGMNFQVALELAEAAKLQPVAFTPAQNAALQIRVIKQRGLPRCFFVQIILLVLHQ